MKILKVFSQKLTEIRKAKGYTSAYKFFRGVGGSKALGVSFMSYWDVERGKKLPKSGRIKPLIAALGLSASSREARELVRAYLVALSGSEELFDMLETRQQDSSPAGEDGLVHDASKRVLDNIRTSMTLEQWEARAKNLCTFACCHFIINTPGWITVDEVAAATGFNKAEVRKALKLLHAVKFLKLAGDKVECDYSKKLVESLPVTPATAPLIARLREHMAELLKGLQRQEVRRMSLRMPKAVMEKYKLQLKKAVDLSVLYGNDDLSETDSAVYLVDSGVYKLFPRE